MTRTGAGEGVRRGAFTLIGVALLVVIVVNGLGTSSRPNAGAAPVARAGASSAGISPAGISSAGAGLPEFDAGLEWPLARFQAPSLWTYTQGHGVTIAVVDTGIDVIQPDFSTAVPVAIDLDPGPRGDESSDSHGTAVAGIIAARGAFANTRHMVGLAPQAILIDVRVAPQAAGATAARIADGILEAVSYKARIINVSLGVPGDDPRLARAVEDAQKRGCLVVASAGDTGAPRYPAALPGVLAVAAADTGLRPLTSQASYKFPVVYAPGKDLYSTAETRYGGYATNLSGSDYATGYVSAAAALVWSRAPELGAAGTRLQLIQSASAGLGPGVIDPLAAVQQLPRNPVIPGTSNGPAPPSAGATVQPASTIRAPAASAGSGLRSAGLVAAITLAILVFLLAFAWLIGRGGGGDTPGSMDVHF